MNFRRFHSPGRSHFVSIPPPPRPSAISSSLRGCYKEVAPRLRQWLIHATSPPNRGRHPPRRRRKVFCLLVITTRWFRSSTQVEQKQNQHCHSLRRRRTRRRRQEERGTELRWRKEEGKMTASGGGAGPGRFAHCCQMRGIYQILLLHDRHNILPVGAYLY